MKAGYAKITAGMLDDGQVIGLTLLAGFKQKAKATDSDMESLRKLGLAKWNDVEKQWQITADGRKVAAYL